MFFQSWRELLPNAPCSHLGDLSARGASHAANGVIGSVTHSHPHTYPLVGYTYGTPYHGATPSYAPHPFKHPQMPYSNPPQYVSHSTYQVGTSTSYPSKPMHQHVHAHTCISSSYSGAASNPYYPFIGPPPVSLAPPTVTPQPQANIVQPAPPQGQVYAQQHVPNPPNLNNVNTGNNKKDLRVLALLSKVLGGE